MSDRELLKQKSLKAFERPGPAKRKGRHVLIRVPDSEQDRPHKSRTKLLVTALVIVVLVAALAGYFIGRSDDPMKKIERPDPVKPLPPSASILHMFQRSAVCTDAPLCSEIGRTILLKNGSAVDAAIAAMFCNSFLNQQSMGLGGGFFMTVYIKDEEKAYAVNARETAPGNASAYMFRGHRDKADKGPLAVGVPGELRGMWTAYKRWGKLPWDSLISPTLDLCNDGFVMSTALHSGLQPYLVNDPHLRRQYYNSERKKFHGPGTLVKPSEALCNTLRRISDKGGDELYNGTLAQDFVDDLNRVGSIITAEDLKNYQAKITEPLAVPLGNGDTLYTPPPPSSGVILVNILNILSGYNFTNSSINSTEDKILTYHRIIEGFKYAYATRTKLGDPDFLDLKELIANVTSPAYGAAIRLRINDTATSNDTATYGATEYMPPDHGTAHISIIANNGDAVSVTSSINFYYGAGFTTQKTGIIMNNVMDDFSSPGFKNYFGLSPSPANFIAPGKRPLSSMSPSIIVDESGNAKFVIGASGGTKITTAVAQVAMRKLWFGQTIKQAVDEARIHHQIFPMKIQYEYGVTEDIIKGLRAKGHGFERYDGRGSVVCALFRNSTGIFGNSDWRKGGDVAGMDKAEPSEAAAVQPAPPDMDHPWKAGLQRRSFISTHMDDIRDTIRLVSPINRFAFFQGFVNDDDEFPPKQYTLRTKLLIAGMVCMVLTSAVGGLVMGKIESERARRNRVPPDPVEALPPSPSKLHVFQKAAVCTDAPRCSDIGRSMLQKNGSAVDAAIAAMFCNGLLNQQSTGIGGGFFMTVYIRDEKKAYTVNARETAPSKASINMFEMNPEKATKGGLAVGVPGEVRGMWEAHKRWGKLPWNTLMDPTVDICLNGFEISKAVYDALEAAPHVKDDKHLREQYYDSYYEEFYKPGTIVKPPDQLCYILKRVSILGGDELYRGRVVQYLEDDVRRVGGVISTSDIYHYKAKISEPIAMPLGNGDILYAPPPPSSGLILANILNILGGYEFTNNSINSTEDKILTYHRIIEGFKFAYATRTKVGDPEFLDIDMKEMIANLTSPEYGMEIRQRINDTETSNDTATYDATEYTQPDHGTSHISVIAENGDAVSVTSSLNFYFGAGFTGLETGMIMNNVMDDFSSPGLNNYFGINPSPANFIAPGKRPLSSMTPSIIVDGNGNVKLVIGSAGGPKITTAVALVAMRKLWFGQTIKQAVDEARIHHQIFPMAVEYEYGITKDIINGLKEKGHGMVRYKGRGSIVCAVFKNQTAIYANADFRKGGDVAGLD